MGRRTPLNKAEVNAALEGLPGWQYKDERLGKTFRFSNYRDTISFVVRLAFEAEVMDHHPMLTVGYNQLVVTTCTHDAGNKVTAMDVALASLIEACYVKGWKQS